MIRLNYYSNMTRNATLATKDRCRDPDILAAGACRGLQTLSRGATQRSTVALQLNCATVAVT
jgi:hypothetical protein